jgi:Mg-chelatase subunit ChlD
MAKKGKKTDTDILINVVLDRSGSMESIRDTTISGFNTYLAEQAKLPGARFSLTQFDTEGIDHDYVAVPVEQVHRLSRDTFVPRGGTPLYDAVAASINAVIAGKPKGKVVFVIITDGAENSSREYTREQVFDLVNRQRKAGWEFVYMGANVDAYEVGSRLGVAARSSYNYAADAAGVANAYAAVSRATTLYRREMVASMDMRAGDEVDGSKPDAGTEAKRPVRRHA